MSKTGTADFISSNEEGKDTEIKKAGNDQGEAQAKRDHLYSSGGNASIEKRSEGEK